MELVVSGLRQVCVAKIRLDLLKENRLIVGRSLRENCFV